MSAGKHAREAQRQRLARQLDKVAALRGEQTHAPELAAPRNLLARWQAQRLARTHGHFLANPRFRPAAEFFLSDLYGTKELSRHDRDLQRIYPIMARLLPPDVVHTIALTMEVSLLAQRLDLQLLRVLVERLGVTDRITEQAYAEGYRLCDNAAQREYQIELIRQVCHDLDAIAGKTLLHRALRLARKPVRMAGLGELHDTVERGFVAFRHMKGADEFIGSLVTRELELLRRIFARHPRPFEVAG